MPSNSASLAMVGVGAYASSVAFTTLGAPGQREPLQLQQQQQLRGLRHTATTDDDFSSASSATFGIGMLAVTGVAASVAQSLKRGSRNITGSKVVTMARGGEAEPDRGKPVATTKEQNGEGSEVAAKPAPMGKINATKAQEDIARFSRLEGPTVDTVRRNSDFAGGLVGGEGAFSNADYNFDPLGLSEKFPTALPFFRESEVKHGRIAMLAFVGFLAPEIATLPYLPERCAKAGTGDAFYGRALDAHDMCASDPATAEPGPLFIILLGAGAIEISTTLLKIILGWGLTLENAGDYPGRLEIGGLLNQLPKTEKDMQVIKLQELKHGRLAMIACGGFFTQAALTGHNFPWVF
jgi:light-harvesting complex I chlorophyll a/b binding protein 1